MNIRTFWDVSEARTASIIRALALTAVFIFVKSRVQVITIADSLMNVLENNNRVPDITFQFFSFPRICFM
jgi:hypothetical protein